jgi:ABC-type multidrug transport system ATPase subunit
MPREHNPTGGPNKNTSFQWINLIYDVRIGKKNRRILSNVEGWVKPGTLTVLMGTTGAGKTTLLDVLADRVLTGTVSGDILLNGSTRDAGTQRSIGYVQQIDTHLPTTTVREALEFSAPLRQPSSSSDEEKLEYVNSISRTSSITDD